MTPHLYPAIKGEMGDWTYYLTSVSIKEAVKHFHFAHEIVAYEDLDHIIQRELSTRSNQIKRYLETNDQRLFGALTVAVYGGKPQFSTITIEASNVLRHLEGKIGVLSFDGEEDYYVLDGQHRLAAMKDTAREQPDSTILEDEISILLIAHKRDDEGIQRARRLFTNLNRYATKTSKAVNIVLDEDDAYAIITRDLLRDESHLRSLTKVSKSTGSKLLATGESLSGNSDRHFLFTITTFYECNKSLLKACAPESFRAQQIRPTDTDLELGYSRCKDWWDKLFINIDFLGACRESIPNVDMNAERSRSGGHVLARPVGLKSLCLAIGTMEPNEPETWNLVRNAVSKFSQISQKPWVDLLWKRDGKMFYGKDRIKAAEGLWKYFLGIDVEHDRVESDWLAFVDPERTENISLEDLEAHG